MAFLGSRVYEKKLAKYKTPGINKKVLGKPRKCLYCGLKYEKIGIRKDTCSSTCRKNLWILRGGVQKKKLRKTIFVDCLYCAEPMVYRKGKKFCGRLCRNHSRFKKSAIWHDLSDFGSEFKFLKY